MKQLVFFDTSYGSLNLGDFIIQDAIKREMAYLTDSCFAARYPTHTPISGNLQNLVPVLSTKTCKAADYKFICGTNIMKSSLFRFSRDWSINLFSCGLYSGAVLLGCGRQPNSRSMDLYTKHIYHKALSERFVHSVRDESTLELVESLGFKAEMTGCPTTWGLDASAIAALYEKKRSQPPRRALFTLTDYDDDDTVDARTFDLIHRKYSEVLFWPQGSRDYEYAKRLGILEKCTLVAPNFDAYKKLMEGDFDYVGTRLHGGIFALSHGHRTVIIAVDHRALDMSRSNNLPVIKRGDFDALEDAMDFSSAPNVVVPHEAIKRWKSQFTVD